MAGRRLIRRLNLCLILCLILWLSLPAALIGQQGEAQGGKQGGKQSAEPIGKLFRRGQAHLRAKAPGKAEAAWKEVLRRQPTHFNARLALGKLYFAQKRKGAQKHLEAARNLRPGSDAAHFHLGRFLESRKMLEEAAESYRQAIRLNARHYTANQRLRTIIRRLRARKTVVERAAEQFWLNPNLAALTLYGRVVMQEAEPRQALWEFEVLRDRLPKMPEVHLWIARAERRLGSLPGEIEAYRAYLKQNSAAVGVWLLMLERLLDAGEYRGAGGPLKELEERSARNRIRPREVARFQFLKGRLLSVQGRAGEAGGLLLSAGLGGYNSERVGAAFRGNVALYPQVGALWLAYGRWLKAALSHAPAADAFLKAGKLAPPLLDQAMAALLEIANAGMAQVTANLALGELALARGDEEQAVARLRKIPPGHKADFRASLLLGKIYRDRGDLEQALHAFTRYVFSFPDRGGMIFARGNLFWEIGQKEVAAAIWGANLEQLRAHPQALTRLAGYLQEDPQAPEKEIAVRQELVLATPENVPNRLRLGDLLVERRRPEEAAEQWEAASTYKPGDFDLLVRLGKSYLNRGETERGAAALGRAAQIGTLELGLAERLARHLLAEKQYPQALAFYWQIYQIEPTHPDLGEALPLLVINTSATPQQRVAAAGLAEKSGRSELAIDLLEEMIHRKAATEHSRVMLAGLYLMNGETEEAERVLQGEPGGAAAGLFSQPGGGRALAILAEAQRRMEKKEELMQTLYAIAKLEPENGEIAKELGVLLSGFGRSNEAYGFLKTGLGSEPENKELLLLFSKAAFGKQEYEETLAALQRLTALEPTHGEARALRIRVLQKMRRWDELITILEEIVAESPRDGGARYKLVSAYLGRFQKEKARPHFEALKKLNPTRARFFRRYFK